MILALLPVALAAQPSLEGHLHGATGTSERAGPNNGGVGLSAGAWFSPRFAAELLAQGGPAGIALRPELRFALTEPQASWGRMEAVVGYGVHLDLQPTPMGAVGLALYMPTTLERWGLRVHGRYLVAGTSPEAFQLTLGLVRKPPPVRVEPEPIPVVVAPSEPEWIPYPVCAYLSAEEAAQAKESLASGGTTDTSSSSEVASVGAEAPEQGSVVVVSRPGDRVEVQGETLTVGVSGMLVLASPPGRMDLTITGAGQALDFVVGVAPDQVVWVRGDTMAAPEPLRIHYPGGSRKISPEERAALEDFIVLLGDWDVQVQGLYSTDGSKASNLALAASRAEATKAVLMELGIAEERIVILPPPDQAPAELSTKEQRSAVVVPVIPGADQ